MIQLQHVSKRYPTGQDALTQINIVLQSGEMAFITGHSGAGKSTLLKLIALLERPSRGRIWVDHQDLSTIKRRNIPYFRRRLGIVFQDHHLLYDRTIYENVALPLIINGFRRHDIGKRVRAALDQVGLLGRDAAYPLALSAGERQRVGIARAVVNTPSVLLADEPTGNLDPSLSHEIMTLFLRFQALGTTVLLATHELELAARMGRRVIRLCDGGQLPDLAPGQAAEVLATP